jgi:hypothetical protein
MTTMNYIGLDVHKKTISYCVKDVSGQIQQEGKVGSTRRELDVGYPEDCLIKARLTHFCRVAQRACCNQNER